MSHIDSFTLATFFGENMGDNDSAYLPWPKLVLSKVAKASTATTVVTGIFSDKVCQCKWIFMQRSLLSPTSFNFLLFIFQFFC
jgi:hypothetical protein